MVQQSQSAAITMALDAPAPPVGEPMSAYSVTAPINARRALLTAANLTIPAPSFFPQSPYHINI